MKVLFLFVIMIYSTSLFALNSAIVGSSADVTTTTTQGAVLMGGGNDVDEAFKWMIRKSGGGDFVIIRWGSLGSYNSYVNGLGTVNSVETIQFDSRSEASDSAVIRKVRNAEALWMAGGDQGNYVDGWKDTPIEDAINYLLNEKKVPVGGTSAGCAIMTPIYWGATSGSWAQYEQANDALTNPFQSGRSGMGFNDFLNPPLLQNTISDQHFAQRNRQPRLVSMMAYAISKGFTPIKGIACNEATAVCVEPDGKAVVYGETANSYAFFLRQYCGAPEVYQSGQPLTWLGGCKVYKVAGTTQGNHFMNVKDWQTVDGSGTWEYWYVDKGTLSMAASPRQSCAVSASANSDRQGHRRILSLTSSLGGLRVGYLLRASDEDVSIDISDVTGKRVVSLDLGRQPAGEQSAFIPVHAKSLSGVYIVRLSNGSQTECAPVRIVN